jgi:hypothetical protein
MLEMVSWRIGAAAAAAGAGAAMSVEARLSLRMLEKRFIV